MNKQHRHPRKVRRTVRFALPAATAATLFMPVAAAAATNPPARLLPLNGTPSPAVAMARTANGVLHLMYQTFTGDTLTGLATISISPQGVVGRPVQALSGWRAGQPGLVVLPDGTFEAFFGAVSPAKANGLWAITSSNAGATWSAPKFVGSGSDVEAFAYASNVTAAISGTTPVVTVGGAGVVVQKGLGPGAATYALGTTKDGDAFDETTAVDATSGEVVDAWQSIDRPGGDYIQGVAPKVQQPEAVPGESLATVNVAGRDKGSGVFAAYTRDGTTVRLLRYHGGTVLVGSSPGVNAADLAAATGPDGRIWVMWGAEGSGGFAVTRSNKAVTRFEPIQHVNASIFSMWRLWGDGQRGPLDLFMDGIPGGKTTPPPGLYHTRVLPLLGANGSARELKDKKGHLIGYVLTVHVTDAGDPVAGATVSVSGKHHMSGANGAAEFVVPILTAVTVQITCPTYQPLVKDVAL